MLMLKLMANAESILILNNAAITPAKGHQFKPNMSFRYLYVYFDHPEGFCFSGLLSVVPVVQTLSCCLKSRTFWGLWFYLHASLNAHWILGCAAPLQSQ